MIKNNKITASNNDSLDAVISFVKKCRENKTDVHSFEIIFTNVRSRCKSASADAVCI